MSTDTTAGNDPEEEPAPDSGAESAAWADASAQADTQNSGPADRADTPADPPIQGTGDDAAATPADAPDAFALKAAGPGQAPAPTAPLPLPQDPVAPEPEPTATPEPEPTATPEERPLSHRLRSEDEILLDGSSVVGRPKSRAAAHWAGVLVWVVALPLTWFLLHDAAAAAVDNSAPSTFGAPARALIELGAGAAVLASALWTASRSSLGAFVVGAVSILTGLPFLIIPRVMTGSVGALLERLTAHSDLGARLSRYFWADAVSGKFIAFGLFMVMVGVVSHRARREGRHEQEIIDRGRMPD
ncbi:hypothetical protein [Actinomyces qiguomingii]|uniref:hypothetical protein n=1 Tax=Actinomyces qiguomingii TaxID=2057800 RepID=UPI001E4A1C5E|nr:hypothetical protein [Actinomyces qiguomingii]